MSNIEQALKAALAAIDLYDYTMTVEESEKFAKAERLCKAALADIDKCEPVGYLCESPDKVARIFVDKPLAIHSHTNTPLYTSPQPRDWVGLSDDDIVNIGMQNFTDIRFAKAIEAKLKQLNTKG